MGSKRGLSRSRPSLAILPLALLATLAVLSQRKWQADRATSQLRQPDQDLGATFAKAAEQDKARAGQPAATAEGAAAARATAAAKDAAAAEVAAATKAFTVADEAAAKAAAAEAQEVKTARANAADEAAAAAAEADATAATAGATEAGAAEVSKADGASDDSSDAWEPAEGEANSDAAAAAGAAGAAEEGTADDAEASAPDAGAAAGEPEPTAEEQMEDEAASLSAAMDSAAGGAAAAGAAGAAAADDAALHLEAGTEVAAAAAGAPAAGMGTADHDGPAEAAAQADSSQSAAAAGQQQPCAHAGQSGGAPSATDALDSVLASTHEYFLSEEDVRRGVAFRGSGARAQAVAAKLLAGQPVHVAVVGGSVTWGQGAIYGGNFGVRFFKWLNATWPSPHHRFTNAAKPAVTSSLYAICGGSMVPQDADIVVLEFAFNDNYPGISLLAPPRAAYEQLMRRMLNFPNSPLVMSMHFFGYWIAKPKLRGPDPPRFYSTGEDDLAVIAQHYDVPVLSVRNAALHHMERGDPGYKVDVMDPHTVEGLNLTDYFYFDDHHPFDLTGHRAMADLLVAVMQDAARHAVRQQAEQAGQQTQQQEQQVGQAAEVQQTQQEQQEVEQQQQADQAERAQRAKQQALPPVPEPMFPGNWESPNPTCRLGASFKDVVVQSQGFEWRPQNPNATDVDSQKWAWQGNEPGAWALLRLNTDLGRAAKRADQARVILGRVCSWRDLGSARVECVAGCRCPTLRLEHKWKHKSTQTALVSFEVSQHPQCDIRVTVAKPAGPDAATILNAVMVDRAGGAGLEMGNVGQWDMMGNVGR